MAWAYEARRNEADIFRELSDVEELPENFAWEDGPLTNEFDPLPDANHSKRRLKLGMKLQYMKGRVGRGRNLYPPTSGGDSC